MQIKIEQKHSDDGGFDCWMVAEVDGVSSWSRQWETANRLLDNYGLTRTIGGGYYTVTDWALKRLGTEFTGEDIERIGEERRVLIAEQERLEKLGQVRCPGCGQMVSKRQTMYASRGRVCPDCYDKYSN